MKKYSFAVFLFYVTLIACKKQKQPMTPQQTTDYREQYKGCFQARIIQYEWSNYASYYSKWDTTYDILTLDYNLKDSISIDPSLKKGPSVTFFKSDGKAYIGACIEDAIKSGNIRVIVGLPNQTGYFTGTDSVVVKDWSGWSHAQQGYIIDAYRIK